MKSIMHPYEKIDIPKYKINILLRINNHILLYAISAETGKIYDIENTLWEPCGYSEWTLCFHTISFQE